MMSRGLLRRAVIWDGESHLLRGDAEQGVRAWAGRGHGGLCIRHRWNWRAVTQTSLAKLTGRLGEYRQRWGTEQRDL